MIPPGGGVHGAKSATGRQRPKSENLHDDLHDGIAGFWRPTFSNKNLPPGARISQEQPGAARGSQGQPGAARSSQEQHPTKPQGLSLR